MGCLLNKSRRNDYKVSKEDSFIKRKQYSWDKRQKIDLKDYTIENVENEEVWRLPNTIQGQQFIIQNCKNSKIFIFDNTDAVNIDDCINCQIVLGAVKGRSFSQSRDEFFNNNWSNIHDFTPMRGESNWCLLPDTIKIEDCVPLPSCEEPHKMNMSLLSDKSVVPYTWGLHKRPAGESCLVAFFSDGQQVHRAREFINSIRQDYPECLLLLSKEVQMQQADAEKAFKTSAYNRVLERGPVIGLHYNGPNCIQYCEKVAMKIATSTGLTGLVYVSTNPKTAQIQVNDFFNYSDIQMTS